MLAKLPRLDCFVYGLSLLFPMLFLCSLLVFVWTPTHARTQWRSELPEVSTMNGICICVREGKNPQHLSSLSPSWTTTCRLKYVPPPHWPDQYPGENTEPNVYVQFSKVARHVTQQSLVRWLSTKRLGPSTSLVRAGVTVSSSGSLHLFFQGKWYSRYQIPPSARTVWVDFIFASICCRVNCT